jgi:hypothetical protein
MEKMTFAIHNDDVGADALVQLLGDPHRHFPAYQALLRMGPASPAR